MEVWSEPCPPYSPTRIHSRVRSKIFHSWRVGAIGPLSPLVGSILALHWYHSLSMVPNKALRAWTEVWSRASRLRSFIMAPGGRDLDGFFEIFEILGGAGDINNSISMWNYWNGPYIHLLPYVNDVSRAWTEVSTGAWPSSRRFWILWLPEVAVWEHFDILTKVKSTTYLKSFIYLWVYAKNGFSSGGTVWTGIWCPGTSIMAPERDVLGRF